MSTIHPFADQGSFTSVHNAVFDVMMPDLPPNAFKVLCLVIRKTRGWIDRETGQRKESDQLSYSQIMIGTGIKAPATLATALKVLIERRYILASAGDTRWDAMTYRLNTALEIEVEPTSKNVVEKSTTKNVAATEIEVEPTSKNVVEPTSKIEHTKERGKKEKEKDGDGGVPPQEKQKGGIPRHVQYLTIKGVGAAKMFTPCDPDATIELYDLMRASGIGNGAIVDSWKINPPTPERVKEFKEQTHAADQPQRLQRTPERSPRAPRPGERGYTGRT